MGKSNYNIIFDYLPVDNRIRVLIVDDNPVNREIVEGQLSTVGYNLFQCKMRHKALRLGEVVV